MTRADKYFQEFIDSFPKEKTDHVAFRQIVMSYARMCAEEDILQGFIDKNGFTYEGVTRDGSILHKKYPQHASLEKVRSQKTATFRTLIKYIKEEDLGEQGDGLFAE